MERIQLDFLSEPDPVLVAIIRHGDDQLAVAHVDVEFAADGEAELFQPPAA